MILADYRAVTQHVESSSLHSPDKREAAARLRTSWSMSAPVSLGYAENGGYAEREKDRAENSVIHSPSKACAEERQGAEQSKVARLGVHSRSRLERGSDQAAPPLCAS